MITKDELLKNYNINEHFQIPCCIVDNPKLNKMLTGEGARVAKELSKEYITIEATYDKENKYQVFKIAEKINANPDVYFFTCVANRYNNSLIIEFWGNETLMTSARLVEENGDVMLEFLIGNSK